MGAGREKYIELIATRDRKIAQLEKEIAGLRRGIRIRDEEESERRVWCLKRGFKFDASAVL